MTGRATGASRDARPARGNEKLPVTCDGLTCNRKSGFIHFVSERQGALISRTAQFARLYHKGSWGLRIRALMLLGVLLAGPLTTCAAEVLHHATQSCSDKMCPMHRKANTAEDSDMPCHKGAGEKPDSTPCSMKACCDTPDAALSPTVSDTILGASLEEPLFRITMLAIEPLFARPLLPFLSPPFQPPRS
jgi:hypothetical protein